MSFIRGSRTMGGFPKPGEELRDVPGRHSREGWVHIKDHDSCTLNGKQYRNMREWKRPCSVCGEAVHAFEKVGTVDASSRFGNRTCDAHRGLGPALEKGYIAWSAEQRAIVPGPSCGTGGEEIAAVKKELDEAYEANADLMQQAGGVRRAIHETLGLSLLGDGITYDTVKAAIESLKAKYELQSAMQAQAQNTDTPVLPNSLPWA